MFHCRFPLSCQVAEQYPHECNFEMWCLHIYFPDPPCTFVFLCLAPPLHPSLDRFKWRVSKITGPGRARGGLRRCRCRVAQSCVKHSLLVPRITLKMFRCPPQKCTIEQYFSQPFPKPDGIFLHYSVFGEKMPPRWLSRDGVSRKSHIHSLLVFCYSSSSICC